MVIRSIVITVFTCSVLNGGMAGGQEVAIGNGVLEAKLLNEGGEILADAALEYGDPQRGAIVFHPQERRDWSHRRTLERRHRSVFRHPSSQL